MKQVYVLRVSFIIFVSLSFEFQLYVLLSVKGTLPKP